MRISPVYSILLVVISGYISSLFAAGHKPIGIHVSIPPQKYLVERVGGREVTVSVLMGRGMNPENYEPTPRQMASLNESVLYFRIGVPFESVWMTRLAELNPHLEIVSCCDSLTIRSHQSDYDIQERYENDSHIWTSPKNAMILARTIKETLISRDPDNRTFYEDNFNRLITELHELDGFIEKSLEGIRHRIMIVSHPSWGHFADAYRLQQISVERHGTEVGAKELARLINLVRDMDIRAIYAQPQYRTTAVEILSRETGAEIMEIDPLAEDYIDNLYQVSLKIREGNR